MQFDIQRQPIILLRRKDIGTRMPHYTIISEKREDNGSGDATVVSSIICEKWHFIHLFIICMSNLILLQVMEL